MHLEPRAESLHRSIGTSPSLVVKVVLHVVVVKVMSFDLMEVSSHCRFVSGPNVDVAESPVFSFARCRELAGLEVERKRRQSDRLEGVMTAEERSDRKREPRVDSRSPFLRNDVFFVDLV